MRAGKWLAVLVGAASMMGPGPVPEGLAGPSPGKRKTRPALARKPAPAPLHMTRAVVCDSIDGFEKYKVLRSAALTSEEKLLVYYRPLGFRSDSPDGSYQARFTQDGQVRKQGQTRILREKIKLLEYSSPKMDFPPKAIFFKNAVSLKGLEPGDYEFIIILHDEVAQGPPAKQTVKFKVVPPRPIGSSETAARDEATAPETASTAPAAADAER